MKKSIRENSGSEVDLVESRHVILEVYYVVESQPLSLTDRVVTDKRLLCWHLCGNALLVDHQIIRKRFRGCLVRDSRDDAYAAAPFDRPCTRADLLL
jgi:hypothetical protein